MDISCAFPRVRAAGGPGWALAYHGAYEVGSPLAELPGGREWQSVIERTAPEERHLAVHEQHCVGLNEADGAAWEAGGDGLLEHVTVTGTRDQVRERLAALADQGVTELVYQPCGPDVRRELEVFIDTARATAAADDPRLMTSRAAIRQASHTLSAVLAGLAESP